MFRKILLPLDGSKTAEQALFWAKQYAGPDKAQVVLLQVLHAEYPLQGRPFRAGAPEARDYLQGVERELNYAGIPTKMLLRNEPVPRTIVETARREACDLIIMTSRGASKVVRWLIGGVTQQVMRLSPIPVFIVRSSVAPSLHVRPRRILVPQDGSPLARTILPLAEGFAHFHRARLALLHVRTGAASTRSRSASGSVTKVLERRVQTLRTQGIRADALVEGGDAAEEILKACKPGDLLVLTTHGYGGLKRLVLGSVAEKVIHQAPVPVLVYKRPAHYRRLPQDLANLELFDS
jgi:nucleotide-binding universal stress UspA family protein